MTESDPPLWCITCDAALVHHHEQQTLTCSACLRALRDAVHDYKRTLESTRKYE